ncbi:hypothetical protein I7I51_03134 [Histoplasma capsulatum]|uniref:PNPLA domain-containing protein n=1 Tax=Ajellomyces capsulatus TaxID=5037 RepID=A0A8A1MQH0_AJECA|nr:hypothetical protein I7I51_03134 [Histoplasma capsulatum]
MHSCDHLTWLRYREGQLEDTGRLGCVVRGLTHPSKQYPRLVHFIGSRIKDGALRQLCPDKKRRGAKTGMINLHLDALSVNTPSPLLFADSDPFGQENSDRANPCHHGAAHPISWPLAADWSFFDILHARLLFLFSDVICVFADDFPTLHSVAARIHTWARIGSASSLPSSTRPTLIVVTSGPGPLSDLLAEDFRAQIHAMGEAFSKSFRSIKLFRLVGDHLSPCARYLRLKEEILSKMQEAQDTRRQYHCLFSSVHLDAFFRQAMQHTAMSISEQFDFIAASRVDNILHDDYTGHLQTFLGLCDRFKIPRGTVSSFMASSILMDAYPPRMHYFPPRVVFRALYERHLLAALEAASYGQNLALTLCRDVETHLETFLRQVVRHDVTSAIRHVDNIRSQYPVLRLPQSNKPFPKSHPTFAKNDHKGGLIIPDIFILGHSASSCSKRSGALARRCFGDSPGTAWARLKAASRYLLTDAMYSEVHLVEFLQEEFGVSRRLFDHVNVSGTRVALTAVSDKGSPSILTNYNGSVPIRPGAGYELVRPRDIDKEPKLWEAGRATSAAPIFFKPAKMAAGCFIDGGLAFPNPFEMAEWEWSRIWPDITEPDVVIAFGTGVEPEEGASSQGSSVRHLWRSFISFLDGESRWRGLENARSDAEKDDYLRFNPTLIEPSRLDNTKDLLTLCRSVYLHPTTREDLVAAAFRLLASNLYFSLDAHPYYADGLYHCQGSIRCRIDCEPVINALADLRMMPVEYVTPSSVLSCGQLNRDICRACHRYRKSIQFDVCHLTDVVALSLRTQNGQSRKLSWFPRTMASFIEAQGLDSPFGTPDHDDPGLLHCGSCLVNAKRKISPEAISPQKKRRR